MLYISLLSYPHNTIFIIISITIWIDAWALRKNIFETAFRFSKYFCLLFWSQIYYFKMLVTLRNHFHFVYIDDLFLACNFALRKVYFSRINVAITQLQTDSKSTMNPKICNRDLLNERITFYSRFTNLCPYCF